MKKVILLVLCLVFMFCGCAKAAVPYTESTNDLLSLTSLYTYCFSDDTYILCTLKNGTDKNMYFYDTFTLEKKTSGGNWTVVDDFKNAKFNTNYNHCVEANTEGLVRYDLDLFTNSLKNGSVYRISAYCFDEEENQYQLYAEFICDDTAAEEEISALSQAAMDAIDERAEKEAAEKAQNS